MKNKITNKLIESNYYHNKKIKLNYGFMVNTNQTLQQNINRILLDMTKNQYFNKLSTMSYHNLCTTQQPPPGIGNLLGLGLKFCIQEKQPSKQKLEEGIQ